MNSGRLITLEGIDGAGKSSHIQALSDLLRARGGEVVVTREPGGTDLAERLRELLLNQPMDALTEALLVFAARRDHLSTLIEPALARGAFVLCDRFTDATFAYQGAGRGFDVGMLTALESMVQGDRRPDLTIWFDLNPAEAALRRSAARQPDRFEQLDEAFFARVREGYAQRCRQQPGRFLLVDAHAPVQAVWDQVERGLQQQPWW